jgi:hypothetical protein
MHKLLMDTVFNPTEYPLSETIGTSSENPFVNPVLTVLGNPHGEYAAVYG